MAMDPVERVRLELSTRRILVMLLGVMTLLVGAVTMMTGAPTFIETWFSPWSRIALGLLAFIPGVMIAIGGLFDDEHPCAWWAHMLGLVGVTLWFGFMCATYTVYTAQIGIHFVRVGEPLPDAGAGRAYVPMIYLILFLMALVPLVTMIKVGRPGR